MAQPAQLTTPEKQTFPKAYHLRTSIEFQRVFDAKNSIANNALVLYTLSNTLGHSRLGLVVSKKRGNAVQRNQIKRWLREAFRLHPATRTTALDLVLIPRVHYKDLNFHILSKTLDSLIQKIQRKAV